MVRGTSRGDDIGKIFVGGLSAETTKESLQEYFSQFGVVTDCIVMVDNMSKRSRGFGFVTFMDPSSVDNVCQKTEHILDGKKIDPKRAVPRGPGQAQVLAQNPGMPTRDASNENKVFVGGLASNVTDDDLRKFFSSFGKVVHVKLMYDKESQRMRGFGFVTFDSSQGVEDACSIRYHEINGKTVEVKKAEQRDSKPAGPGLNMPMGGPQMNSGYSRGQYGYPQPAAGGQFGAPPGGMGRGYGGYGAMTPGYAGAPAMVGAGYGYGMGSAGMPAGYGAQPSMYSQGPASSAAGYGTTYPVPTSAPSMPPTSAGYPDYSQMTASQPGMAGAAPGAPPHLESTATTDYSAYGLGNYQQQESSYGPARTSFSSDASYSSYSTTDQSAYSGAGSYGESFGRGANVSRGFHPYGR